MAIEIKTNTKPVMIGRLNANLKSEVYPDMPIGDTNVEVEGKTLCWVSGKQRDEFIEKLNELINEYEIWVFITTMRINCGQITNDF